MWISNMLTVPILSQDRTRSPQLEIRKRAEVELKIIEQQRRLCCGPGIFPKFHHDDRRHSSRDTQVKSTTRAFFFASVKLRFIRILPFPRRIAAPHDPPSFLPVPPACQSPVTSAHSWLPSWASELIGSTPHKFNTLTKNRISPEFSLYTDPVWSSALKNPTITL